MKMSILFLNKHFDTPKFALSFRTLILDKYYHKTPKTSTIITNITLSLRSQKCEDSIVIFDGGYYSEAMFRYYVMMALFLLIIDTVS